MIDAYLVENGRVRPAGSAEGGALPQAALWLDLRAPDRAEEEAVEALLGVGIPNRDEMREIESSSRLYSEDGADYMTVILPYDAGEGHKSTAPVTFVLTEGRLATLRYAEHKIFRVFAEKLCRNADDPDFEAIATVGENPAKGAAAETLLIGLLETVVDRLADLLEAVAADLDAISGDIFRRRDGRAPITNADFKDLLRRIGRTGELASHLRESLASLDRMLPFLQVVLERRGRAKALRPRLRALTRDLQSLSDFVSFLSNKTSFLLDTTVGMISIEQNGIIKIFSVAAVGFMPPTLVASVYGMNFVHMPELGWRYGYPMALGLMVVSAVLPLLYFRLRRWL